MTGQGILRLELNLLTKLLFLKSLDRSRYFFLLESQEVLWLLFKDLSVLLLDNDFYSSWGDFSNYSSSSFSREALI